MAFDELSWFWDTGGGGDDAQVTEVDWSDVAAILAACMSFQGIAPDYLNALEATVTGAETVEVETGGAVVDGHLYRNHGVGTVNIPSAVGGGNTRIDRIVLRCNWSAATVRVTRLAGVDAATPSVPSLTQTPGTTYDLPLYQALVNTSGAVSLTDERDWARPGTDAVATAALQDDAVTAAKVADGAIDATAKLGDGIVTAAKIAAAVAGDGLTGGAGSALAVNVDGTTIEISGDALQVVARDREIFIPASRGVRNDTSAELAHSSRGLAMVDGVSCSAFGTFAIPKDWVSGCVVQAVISPAANGTVIFTIDATYGADAQAYNTHTGTASSSEAVTGNDIEQVGAVSLSSVDDGDFVQLTFTRNGASGSDTVNNTVYFLGFVVLYGALL